MTEEEAKEIIKNLFLMPTDWKIRKSYKGKLDFIGALEGNEALELILNLIQKQDTEINKLKNGIDRMAEKINQAYFDKENMYKWFEEEILPKDEFGLCEYKDLGTRKKIIKEYFMKEKRRGEYE